jgi:S-methylmethionine-dependent homocysteine/selenocysteine methylase
MNIMGFIETFEQSPFFITDGGIETRIAYETSIQMDPDMSVFKLIYESEGKKALEHIYRQYLNAGRHYDIPIQIGTPTFRASEGRLRRLGFGAPQDIERVNRDCVLMLKQLREEYGDYASKIFIAGVVGPKGDAYKPKEAPGEDEALAYHTPQIKALAQAGVDLLFAPTFPKASELYGASKAMAASRLPYVISPVIRPNGKLLDGTSLSEMISYIDQSVSPKPAYYTISCVHPSLCRQALLLQRQESSRQVQRIRGIKANTSKRTPEELALLHKLDAADPETFADELIALVMEFRFKILGGCCGTDNRHINSLAQKLFTE